MGREVRVRTDRGPNLFLERIHLSQESQSNVDLRGTRYIDTRPSTSLRGESRVLFPVDRNPPTDTTPTVTWSRQGRVLKTFEGPGEIGKTENVQDPLKRENLGKDEFFI